jgi:hypothetical protein
MDSPLAKRPARRVWRSRRAQGTSQTGRQKQPRTEKLFTLSSKAGSNVAERSAILIQAYPPRLPAAGTHACPQFQTCRAGQYRQPARIASTSATPRTLYMAWATSSGPPQPVGRTAASRGRPPRQRRSAGGTASTNLSLSLGPWAPAVRDVGPLTGRPVEATMTVGVAQPPRLGSPDWETDR